MLSLSRPPIVEAMIDLTFGTSEDVSLEMLRPVVEEFAGERGLQVTERTRRSPRLGAVEASAVPYALVARSDDAPVYQFRCNGVTVSLLAPYKGWDALVACAAEAFAVAVKPMTALSVLKVSARYLNKLSVNPNREVGFDDFINLGLPAFNDDLNTLEALNLTMQVAGGDGVRAILKVASVPGTDEMEASAVMLDIDVTWTEELPARFEDVALKLGELRDRKNEIFENVVSPTAMEAFK